MNKHITLVQGNNRRAKIFRLNQKGTAPIGSEIKISVNDWEKRSWTKKRWHETQGAYNPYTMVKNTRGNFKPEARMCKKKEHSNLTPAQKSQVHELKLKSGWLNGRTPPQGFQINEETGEIEPTSQLVSTIRVAATNMAHYGQTYGQESIGLPPPPHLVGDSINGAGDNNNSVQVGGTFERTSIRYPPLNNSTISSVTVNGKSYRRPIFDKRGNRLN